MKKVLSVLLIVVLLFVFCYPALAEGIEIPEAFPTMTLPKAAKIVKTASAKAGTVKALKKGAIVEIIGESNGYYRVVYGNYAGYIVKTAFDATSTTHAPIGKFVYAEHAIYSSPIGVSTLANTLVYIVGSVYEKCFEQNVYYAKVKCEDGDWLVAFLDKTSSDFFHLNKKVTITGIYYGYSMRFNMPVMIAADTETALILQEAYPEIMEEASNYGKTVYQLPLHIYSLTKGY